MSTSARNNFDVLRLLFALFVLYAHAFGMSAPDGEPLWKLTHGTLSLAHIGVSGFFVISGFLVWRSMLASSSALVYLAKRALRIFPALILVVLLSACVLGPLVTTLPQRVYWTDAATWNYALNPLHMLRGGVRFDLPGVFDTSPIRSVNGSLWTIPYELFLYGLLTCFFMLKRVKGGPVIALVVLYASVWAMLFRPISGTIPHTSFAYAQIASSASFFLAGSLMAQFQWEHVIARPVALRGLFAALFAAGVWGGYGLLQHLLLPPLVIGLAYLPLGLRLPERLGDVSYGTYLSGWPVLQVLFLCAGITGLALFLSAAALAGGYGYLSWHLVEKRALLLKRIVR